MDPASALLVINVINALVEAGVNATDALTYVSGKLKAAHAANQTLSVTDFAAMVLSHDQVQASYIAKLLNVAPAAPVAAS